MLERLLEAVKAGELEASSARAKALLRRLEGARAALDEIGGPRVRKRVAAVAKKPAKSKARSGTPGRGLSLMGGGTGPRRRPS
jgi:hypothetical protein